MTRGLTVGAAVLAVTLTMASCGPDRVGIGDLPVPDLASDEPFEGSFETRLDLEIDQIRQEVGLDADTAERILVLPDDVDPDEILAFYAAELDEFSTDGEPSVTQHHTRATWRNGDQRLVVAVIDATTLPDDPATTAVDPSIFLVLFA